MLDSACGMCNTVAFVVGDYAGFPGCGLLRLHSTYRHDLKIYASDEGRVQMTAAAFAKVRSCPPIHDAGGLLAAPFPHAWLRGICHITL